MLRIAIVLFVFAAVFGVISLTPILQKQPTSKPTVFLHGVLAAAGLITVIVAVARAADAAPLMALILLIVAALGGFILLGIDMQKKAVPKSLAVLHPIIAAAGLVTLFIFVMGHH
jgi:hypothetical protein